MQDFFEVAVDWACDEPQALLRLNVQYPLACAGNRITVPGIFNQNAFPKAKGPEH